MKVEISADSLAQYKRIQEPHQSRIRKKMDLLAVHGLHLNAVKALTGEYAGRYRLRVGQYRVIFRVENDTAMVDSIMHRKDVYEK